jgi:hypothetical protein
MFCTGHHKGDEEEGNLYISGKAHIKSITEDLSSLEDGKCENRFMLKLKAGNMKGGRRK